jgi:polysaccharide export outer membrane protein
MSNRQRNVRFPTMLGLMVCLLATMTGCQPFDHYSNTLQTPLPREMQMPTELNMVSLPEYRLEPPDIVQIEVQKLIPKPPYRIDNFDVLEIRAEFSTPEFPVDGFFVIDDSGYLDLGPGYGKFYVLGALLDEIRPNIAARIKHAMSRYLGAETRMPQVSVRLARTGGTQQINGFYLVQPGGVINLNRCGTVHVAGMTLQETRLAVEKQLEQFFDSPRVSVSVAGYNSKKYYVIFEGSGDGEDVITLPITGKDTVLDALSKAIAKNPGNTEIWISRPAPNDFGCEQILPVDFEAITRGGSTTTNYQIMPGDRIYVAEDGQLAMNNYVMKATSPIYRLLGITTLGSSTVKGLQTTGRNYNRQRRGF